jgi:carbamate kinase
VRLVVALGGNALLERGERPDARIQESHVREAIRAVAPLYRDHEIVLTHGNGPQVGLLAAQSASDASLSQPYPFDVLDAQTQGMIGYWLVQALDNALASRAVVGVLCRTEVDPDDPAFTDPTKFVGAVYDEATAHALAAANGWAVRRDGTAWRRVVPSPEPRVIVELPIIERLLDAGVVVVCAGGGGIPVVRGPHGHHGVEAVVDKDLTAAVLAEALRADALLLLSDVDAVELDYATPEARPLRHTTVAQLRAHSFAPGSMGPKVEAACRFVSATHGRAMIGRLGDAPALLAGEAGTVIDT